MRKGDKMKVETIRNITSKSMANLLLTHEKEIVEQHFITLENFCDIYIDSAIKVIMMNFSLHGIFYKIMLIENKC